MKLAAVVVLYHPSDDVADNINSYLEQVDCLLLWDNTPSGQASPLPVSRLIHPERVECMTEGDNMGIGKALNMGIDFAMRHGCTHLATFDQDSSFAPGVMQSYVQAIKQREASAGAIAIYSTNYYIRSQAKPMYPVEDSTVEVQSAMTSASIYPMSIFDRLGRFMEELFVWGIDCEFCWRAARHGIATLCFRGIVLQHDLGYQRRKHRLLGKEVFPNEYPAARTYYNVRNGILLHKLYPDCLDLKAHLRYHLYKRIVFILLYEDGKTAKLRALWGGWRDGRRGKYGPR